jgi:hypothetical protein
MTAYLLDYCTHGTLTILNVSKDEEKQELSFMVCGNAK